MPVIKSAKKKLRQDIKRTLENKKLKDILQKTIKKAKKSKTEASVRVAFKVIDKSAKKGIIHKNKAARLKSSLSKLIKIKSKSEKKTSPKKFPVSLKTSKKR